jgi:predicted lipoprotein
MQRIFRMERIKFLKAGLGAILLLALAALLSSCRLYTVVRLEKNADAGQEVKVYFDNNAFDADKYVDAIWEKKAVPYILAKAVDVRLVIPELKKGTDAAGSKYGIRDSAEGSPWNFIVKGRGRIVAVHTVSRNGTVDLDLPPYDNQPDLKIQIGPVIKGTSIRDTLNFISFDDFENQIEFARLANAFNLRIYNQILSKLNFESLKDKEVEFDGTFTADGSGALMIVPVRVAPVGGGE